MKSIMPEEWKIIDWVDGLKHIYAISTFGRIKKLPYINKYKCGIIRHEKERMLSPFDNGNGYKVVSITVNGNRKNFYIHRLVATAFIPNPFEKPEVNHLDYDRGNNYVGNLEWCTDKENTKYSSWKVRHPRPSCRCNEFGRGIRKKNHGYEVAIYHNNKQHYIGTFKQHEDAIKARDEAYKKFGLGEWVNQL